ncbi:MAG: hypothetical protein RL014_2898 [Pseudomonadota bacterium]|jgi:hypothetical protein
MNGPQKDQTPLAGGAGGLGKATESVARIVPLNATGRKIKSIIVALAVRGVIPAKLATKLIQRGGLIHA